MESSPPTEDGVEARFFPSQKGTMLLRNENNFNYRIHKKNTDGTKIHRLNFEQLNFKRPNFVRLNFERPEENTSSCVFYILHRQWLGIN
jgi:hypothetical protein